MPECDARRYCRESGGNEKRCIELTGVKKARKSLREIVLFISMLHYKLLKSKSTKKNGILGNQPMLIIIRLKLLLLLLLAASAVSAAPNSRINNANCGIVSGQLTGGVNSYGYLDYINPADQTKLAQANKTYFRSPDNRNPNAYPKGVTKPLRISPNHHQALYAMLTYYKGPRPNKNDEGEGYSMECYFKRASFHSPKDATVYMLHGMYYHWKSDWTNSEEQYMQASKLQPGNVQITYNLGLMYFEKGDYESAAKQARIAYDRGFPMEGLRKKLKKVNISVN